MPASSSRSKSKSAQAEEALREALQALRDLHAKDLDDRLDSIEELVCAVFTDDGATEEEALEAVRRLRRTYVNWNEARVARLAELARIIEPLNNADELARRIRELLERVFDRTGAVALSHLREMKVSEARRALMEIEPVGRTVADRILMLELPGANIPFSTEATRLAKRLKLIANSANRQSLNKLVGEALRREEAVDFYHLAEIHVAAGCTKSKCPLCKKT
jgi:endonuclease III